MPVERFPSEGYDNKPKEHPQEYDFYLLDESISRVLKAQGINVLNADYAEDDQMGTSIKVFTIGQSEQDATTIVLVGLEPLRTDSLLAFGTDRPHKIIAPQGIINAVRIQYEELRQSGFEPPYPSSPVFQTP